MSATIAVAGVRAELRDDDGKWHCENPQLEAFLNRLLTLYEGSGADPNPAYTIAVQAAAVLGGTVVAWDPTTTDELIPPGA